MPGMPKKKREALPPRPTHCHWCGQEMSIDASHIDWEEVWFRAALGRERSKLRRVLTGDEEELARGVRSVRRLLLRDCCCGGCGGRKVVSGEVCG